MRILAAHPSSSFLSLVQKYLEPEFEVVCCWDGEDTSKVLEALCPDALLLHPGLPRKDGITLLEQTAYKPPVILAITDLNDLDQFARLQNLGVTGVLVMPTLQTLAATLTRQLQELPNLLPVQTYPQLLRSLGIKANLQGFSQLCLAAELLSQNADMPLNCQVYPAIAKTLNSTNGKAVEKSIRDAIKKAWQVRDKETWSRYFPSDKCPTNSEFLMATLQPYLNRGAEHHAVFCNSTVHG